MMLHVSSCCGFPLKIGSLFTSLILTFIFVLRTINAFALADRLLNSGNQGTNNEFGMTNSDNPHVEEPFKFNPFLLPGFWLIVINMLVGIIGCFQCSALCLFIYLELPRLIAGCLKGVISVLVALALLILVEPVAFLIKAPLGPSYLAVLLLSSCILIPLLMVVNSYHTDLIKRDPSNSKIAIHLRS